MAISADEIIPPIEGAADILRICTLRMPNPHYMRNLTLCMEGIVTAIQHLQPETELTFTVVRQYTALPDLLLLQRSVEAAGGKNEKLAQYIETLPGINRKTNKPGWRWQTALKRHNKRMRGGLAYTAIFLNIRKTHQKKKS
ncbi:hypothetical protein [Enterobacter ludwigii]|uniref:hypothetical protein n=1 Tax=Enterobacter ludwigii TaxID=299767 RepID=UPI003F71D167